MNNENLVEFICGMAESGSKAARNLGTGEPVSQGDYGDRKYEIDAAATEALIKYFEEESDRYDFSVALKPEDAEWDEGWKLSDGTTIPGSDLEQVDYGLVIDPVEGTKNQTNRDRYTAIAAINPEDPTLDGVEASSIHRWDDTLFFSDGTNAYKSNNGEALNNPNPLRVPEMDEVGYLTKITGQRMGQHSKDIAEFENRLIEEFNLNHQDMPSGKGDGTTAGDILAVVEDNGIAVDLRAIRGFDRAPYPYDFAPAAKILRDSGGKLYNPDLEQVDTDLSDSGEPTSFLATPPGKATENIEKVFSNLVEDIKTEQ